MQYWFAMIRIPRCGSALLGTGDKCNRSNQDTLLRSIVGFLCAWNKRPGKWTRNKDDVSSDILSAQFNTSMAPPQTEPSSVVLPITRERPLPVQVLRDAARRLRLSASFLRAFSAEHMFWKD